MVGFPSKPFNEEPLVNRKQKITPVRGNEGFLFLEEAVCIIMLNKLRVPLKTIPNR